MEFRRPGPFPDGRASLERAADSAACNITENVDDDTRRVNLRGAIARTTVRETNSSCFDGLRSILTDALCVQNSDGNRSRSLFSAANRQQHLKFRCLLSLSPPWWLR